MLQRVNLESNKVMSRPERRKALAVERKELTDMSASNEGVS